MRAIVEGKRGCGYRKPGGLYLVGHNLSEWCSLLPFILDVCPTCGAGIRPARGFTWINGSSLIGRRHHQTTSHETNCPLGAAGPSQIDKAGLIWVGEQYYHSPQDFLNESLSMGVSRRISRVPRGFVIGETWIFLAHRKVKADIVAGTEVAWNAGIFAVFRPRAIEYVVKGNESQATLDSLEKRGIEPVIVIPEHQETMS